jgi:hypothetical protein
LKAKHGRVMIIVIIRREIKRIIFSALLIFLFFILTSCQTPNVEGLNVGFGYTLEPHAIMVGVKSEETQFEINNIQLDFYYGFDGSFSFSTDNENDELTGFGIYFCYGEYLYSIKAYRQTVFDNYHSVENHIFVKEVLSEERLTGDFGYTNNYSSGVQYAHHEMFTVPSEVILGTKGKIYFRIIAIQYSADGNYYFFTEQNVIRIDYETLDNGKVKLIYSSIGV